MVSNLTQESFQTKAEELLTVLPLNILKTRNDLYHLIKSKKLLIHKKYIKKDYF